MSSEQPTKITDWVKANSSVSKVAADLGKSRPSVYRWMEMYDDGNKDQLPEEVLAYFDKNIAEGESLTVIKMKASLTDKMRKLSDKIADQQNRIPMFLTQKAELSMHIARVTEEFESVTDEQKKNHLAKEIAMLRSEEKDLECRIAGYEAELSSMIEEYKEVQEKLARYDSSVVSITMKAKEIYPIKTTCTIEGNRCMIIHNGKSNLLDYRFILQVFGKVGEDFVFLKEYLSDTTPYYEHDWDEEPIGSVSTNYFIIEDFLFSGPLFYKIVGYDGNGGDNDEENTSGMCELKQSH